MTDAQSLTQSLGGKWHGRYGTAACPVCQPERRNGQTALTIAERDDRSGLLLNCKKAHCKFGEILAAAGVISGVFTPPDPIARREAEAKREANAIKRARQCVSLWSEAQPIGGTIAENYLRGRGITCGLSRALRFHPAAWHPSGKHHPAMLGLVEGCPLIALHRTYLAVDGGAKAKLDPAKAMLGATTGGAVRLTRANGPLVVAEGIETALSLACGLIRGPATIWAALSTSGMVGLHLPPMPGEIIIASDGDEAGRASAQDLARRAYALGWTVNMFPAPDGRDWNDYLQSRETTHGRA